MSQISEEANCNPMLRGNLKKKLGAYKGSVLQGTGKGNDYGRLIYLIKTFLNLICFSYIRLFLKLEFPVQFCQQFPLGVMQKFYFSYQLYENFASITYILY